MQMRSTTMRVIGVASVLAFTSAPVALLSQQARATDIFTDSNVILSVNDVRKSVAFYETSLSSSWNTM